jgi:hypothetical protein
MVTPEGHLLEQQAFHRRHRPTWFEFTHNWKLLFVPLRAIHTALVRCVGAELRRYGSDEYAMQYANGRRAHVSGIGANVVRAYAGVRLSGWDRL